MQKIISFFILALFIDQFSCGKKEPTKQRNSTPVQVTDKFLKCNFLDGNSGSYGCSLKTKQGESDVSEIKTWYLKLVFRDESREITPHASPQNENYQVTFDLPPEIEEKEETFFVKARVSINNRSTWFISCPRGFVFVPGDPVFGTKDFCVMKYEAMDKNKENDPGLISKIGDSYHLAKNIDEAITLCSDLGQEYSLINNSEWMTIATNISSLAQNWSEDEVGKGMINKGPPIRDKNGVLVVIRNDQSFLTGNDDDKNPCFGTIAFHCQDKTSNQWIYKRTHQLTTGEIIWDFSGNLRELINEPATFMINRPQKFKPDLIFSGVEINKVQGSDKFPLTNIRPTHETHAFWDDSWNSSQGFGRYLYGLNGIPLRGGKLELFENYINTGIFGLKFATSLTDTNPGIRCVFRDK